MRITRETDYAVRCILYLAERTNEDVASSEISEAMSIPQSFLQKTVQKLVKGKLLQSLKGARGGVRLLKSPEEISLLDVVEVVQGPLAVNLCALEENKCERESSCSVHPAWVKVQGVIEDELRNYTFKKLMQSDKKD